MTNAGAPTLEYGRSTKSRRRWIVLSSLLALALICFMAWRQYGLDARAWWNDVQAWRLARRGAIAQGPFDVGAAYPTTRPSPAASARAYERWTAQVLPIRFALESRVLPRLTHSPGRTPLAIHRLRDTSGAERLASVAIDASFFDPPEGAFVNVRAVVCLFDVGSLRSPGFRPMKALVSQTTKRFADVGVSEYFDWLSVDVVEFSPGHDLIFEQAIVDPSHADAIRVPFVIDGFRDSLLIRREAGDKVSVSRESGRLKDDRSALQPATTRSAA